ncbi:MAG: Sapep family Mn(2+)-dependent dipeptidase [Christensenellales bacterium]|jgi:succinyl-diaminopimelate desuccinylase
MYRKLDEILVSLRPQMVETLKRWVAIPSVKGEKAQGAPYGVEVRRCLDQALKDCADLGFEVENIGNHAGHADFGKGDDYEALAILAHLDVVPVGEGWTREPFNPVVEDGIMYGRGTSDDKGPAVAALYAMKAVKDLGIPLKRKVRLILGCDEESGWEDMRYYAQHATLPRSGFSPDADYPVINIEKGGMHISIEAELPTEGLQVLSFNTGERPNVVPGSAKAKIQDGADLLQKVDELSKKYGWKVSAQEEDGCVHIQTTGIPGHAAYPEATLNAIGMMLVILRDLGATGSLATLANTIGITYHGENMNASVEDGQSGKLTCNIGIIRVENNKLYALLDLRTPVLANHQEIFKAISASMPDCNLTLVFSRPPHVVPESSELVQKLLDAYHEVTGNEKKALAIGGGTYAKVLEEGVAFGASFPGDPEVAHQADEHIRLESLYKSMKIFALAIIKLCGQNEN